MIASMMLALALVGQTAEYNPGDRVILHVGHGTEVMVATNFLWVDDLLNAGIASDLEGVKQLYREGKLALLPDETKALVIRSIPVPAPGSGLSFIPVYEVRVNTSKYYVFAPYMVTPAELANEQARDARKMEIQKKAIRKSARGKIAKSTLTPKQRQEQIERNLARNRQLQNP